MKGFLKYTMHATALAILLLVLGIVFLPFAFLAPFALLSILFYPLFKLMMPERMKEKGY